MLAFTGAIAGEVEQLAHALAKAGLPMVDLARPRTGLLFVSTPDASGHHPVFLAESIHDDLIFGHDGFDAIGDGAAKTNAGRWRR